MRLSIELDLNCQRDRLVSSSCKMRLLELFDDRPPIDAGFEVFQEPFDDFTRGFPTALANSSSRRPAAVLDHSAHRSKESSSAAGDTRIVCGLP